MPELRQRIGIERAIQREVLSNGVARHGWRAAGEEPAPRPEAGQNGQSLPKSVALGVAGLGLEPAQ
eukprot:9551654-Alexandrium_andersonii.AAC.1